MIPEASRDDLLHALERFDREYRDSTEWRDWLDNASHKYAIRHEGRLYPVKQIISLATGTPRDSFSGGDEANRYVEARGLEVERLPHSLRGLSDVLERIVADYNAPDRGPISKDHPLWKLFGKAAALLRDSPAVAPTEHIKVQPSVGQGNWAKVPWIALMDDRETTSTQHGVYVVYLFREDMSAVYLTFNQGVTEVFSSHDVRRARQLLRERAQDYAKYAEPLRTFGFHLDDSIDLRTKSSLGKKYETSTIAHKLYTRGSVPDDEELGEDLEAVLETYDRYLSDITSRKKTPVAPRRPDDAHKARALIDWVRSQGYFFEPWQLSTYLAAARTKPFIILAGVSGSGKSRLPQLIAEATGAAHDLLPVRPDWTDSAELLGYRDLREQFHPGPLLRMAHEASSNPERLHVCVIDEMNLARVEYYFAEVLSRIEDDPDMVGQRPLLSGVPGLGNEGSLWFDVVLPSNLLLVGTVNMDESTYGFSKKVLDRAFTIEFSRIFLSEWEQSELSVGEPPDLRATWWQPRARRLSQLEEPSDRERALIATAVDSLEAANEALQPAQLHVGYRVRDELALFLIHAEPLREMFLDSNDDPVDLLDVGLSMKLLPRISGGSNLVREVVRRLLAWSTTGVGDMTERDVEKLVERWVDAGSADLLPEAAHPRTAGRLCLMWQRLETEGFTSYWL